MDEGEGRKEGGQGEKGCHPSGRGAHRLLGGALGSGLAPRRRWGPCADPSALGQCRHAVGGARDQPRPQGLPRAAYRQQVAASSLVGVPHLILEEEDA